MTLFSSSIKLFNTLVLKRFIYDEICLKNTKFLSYITNIENIQPNSDSFNLKDKIMDLYKSFYSRTIECDELEDFISKVHEQELQQIAMDDKDKCKFDIEVLKSKLFSCLMLWELKYPTNKSINNDDLTDLPYCDGITLEITSGVGGQEASLFVNELFEVYHKYSASLGLNFDISQSEKTDSGGLRKAYAKITGDADLIQNFRYESGVHRIQRVPKTERYGRIHTSTIAVSVLPHQQNEDVELLRKDLIIETCRAQGKGGQHVNTTDSAVRIVHIPTGTVIERQEERSQLVNKERALQALKEKIDGTRNQDQSTRSQDARKAQRGTLARSEKIRTYNFPQDRITDHRTGQTFHNLKQFFQDQNASAFHHLVTCVDDHTKREKFRQIMSRY